VNQVSHEQLKEKKVYMRKKTKSI